jgi:hypothetical protein
MCKYCTSLQDDVSIALAYRNDVSIAVAYRKDVSIALAYRKAAVYAVLCWQENVQHLAKRKGRMCAGRCYDL